MRGRDDAPWTLTARWVFPVQGPPIANGTVTICGTQIVAVGRQLDRKPEFDLGCTAIVPGFVNAHIHLDLTGLRGKTPPTEDFTQWLRAVIHCRRSLSAEQVVEDISAGLRESVSHGTTLLGDISMRGASWPVLARSDCSRAVVFYELLGLPKARSHQAWAGACAWLNSNPGIVNCRQALSPHAPYSVRTSLFRAAARLAQRRSLPVAIHLAETRAELELLELRHGPFVSFLSELDAWDSEGISRGVDEIISLNGGAASVLFAHGNYLSSYNCIPRNATIIYCPRTHAAFGHSPHPFRSLLAAGAPVALGTDSLASNPDLNLWAEAQFLHHRYPDMAMDMLLRMATLAGAGALGWEGETGSLTTGKSADLVVLSVPQEQPPDPHELILSPSAGVQAVLFQGKWVFAKDRFKCLQET